MADDSIPRSILLVVLIIAGGFFAGSETAFSYCNKIRIKTLAEGGNKRAKRTVSIWEDFDKALITILIGNNIIHIAASSIATVMAVSLMGNSGSVVSTVVLTLLIFMFSEMIPKNFAKANSDAFAMAVSAPLKALMIILTPVAILFTGLSNLFKKLFGHKEKAPTITDDEFQEAVDTIEEDGVIAPEEGEIIRSAIEFSDIRTRDVMTPRDKIVALDVKSCPEKVKEVLLNEKYSRIPVFSGGIDNIIGVIRTKNCLLNMKNGRPVNLEKSLSKPYRVSPDTCVDALFEEMCKLRNHLAIVTSDKGETLGIVTMEDILEEIVGEIYDEDETDGKPDKGGQKYPNPMPAAVGKGGSL